MVGPLPRTGHISVLLPSGAPEEQLIPFVRQRVMHALAATGEWPVRIDIVSGRGRGEGSMQRWFIEYETGDAALHGPDAQLTA